MSWQLLATIGGLVLATCAIVFRFLPRMASNHLKAANVGAQTLVAIVTAIAITMAGLLYILERQWSPRFTVDLKASPFTRPGLIPQVVLVQVTVAVSNDGRVGATINGIEVAAVALQTDEVRSPDSSGDQPGVLLSRFVSSRPTEVAAGETDVMYAELVVPCVSPVVRIIAKVPRPPYRAKDPIGTRRVYERKLLVSLTDACPNEAPSMKVGPRP